MMIKRIETTPRENYQDIVSKLGLDFHQDYWTEKAYYEIPLETINELETASNLVHDQYLEACQCIIDENRFDELGINNKRVENLIRDSWNSETDFSVYGRFDWSIGIDNSLKVLEYNADTPTSLFEASVVQWDWLQDKFKWHDQFNSIHEKLIECWAEFNALGKTIHFTSVNTPEDICTSVYLADTARQAGHPTEFLVLEDIGWDKDNEQFVDLEMKEISHLFKLYPWEWLLSDEYGEYVLSRSSSTKFIEPAWKMLLSNKGTYALLSELFPENKYLLKTRFSDVEFTNNIRVKKHFFSREGQGITIYNETNILEYSPFTTEENRDMFIYQEYHEGISFGELKPIFGVWVIGGEARGLGIREDKGITTNMANFVPHIID